MGRGLLSTAMTFIRSREEIELWKEKQRQVKKEEESIRASENIKSKDGGKKASEQHVSAVNNNNWMSGRQEMHPIERREIWIQQAAIFIEQVNILYHDGSFH